MQEDDFRVAKFFRKNGKTDDKFHQFVFKPLTGSERTKTSNFRHLPDSCAGGGRSGGRSWCWDIFLEEERRKPAICQKYLTP